MGRSDQIARLRRALERARTEQPCFVLIEGPAGIGKTALLNRFLDECRDACVLRASGEESERALPGGVLDQLLRATAGEGTSHGGGDTARSSPDPLTMGAQLVERLGELQQVAPVVTVVLDDAHWADRASLLALTFALRRLLVDRVLVVVVLRDLVDAQLPDGLARVLSSERTARLVLPGLSSRELRALSEQVGTTPLSRRAAARLRAHTGGNPLHARTLLEQLPPSAFDDVHETIPAPRGFAMLVLARLASCRAEVRDFVGAASVMGRRCPIHCVGDVAGTVEPLVAVDEAVAAGLLVEQLGARTVEFPHPLVRAAVYQQLGATMRTELHRRAAALADDESERLRHRLGAASRPDAELAADLAEHGRRQMLLGAWSTASQHLVAAAEISPSRGDRERFATEAIESQLMAGDAPDPVALLSRLRSFADTTWRSYVLARLALMDGRLDDAEHLLHDAWQRCGDEPDSELGARIAGQLAWLYVARDRGVEAVRWSDRALTVAAGDETTDISWLIHLVAFGLTGRSAEGLDVLDELPDATVASVIELDQLLGRARLRSWTDDLPGAYADLTGVLGAAQGRSITFQVIASAMLAEVEYLLGRWDDAVVHSGLAVSLACDAEQAWLVSICDAVAAYVPAARGDSKRSRAHLEAGETRLMHSGHVVATSYLASASARLAAAEDTPEQVIATLRPLAELGPDSGIAEPGVLARWQDLLVEALVAEGCHDEAEEHLVRFEARATERQLHSAMAAAARARGTLLAGRRDHEGAEAAFRLGLAHIGQVDMPFDHGLLELATGTWLRRAGKRRAAAAELLAARARFERLGALPYLERCDRELAACGANLAAMPRVVATGATTLTPQEFAVAQLASQGLTNKQIGRKLVISVKTVDYHLGHVYAKLQLSSRVQLARHFGPDGVSGPRTEADSNT